MEEGQNVLCTVKRIEGTTVFVDLANDGEGTIITSEIAPGRIRNLRDYVVPGKKVVCKILEIKDKNIHLSLRRVTDKEKREVLESHKKEKSSESIIKSVEKEAEEIIKKIREKEKSLFEFLRSIKENPQKLTQYFSKEGVEKLLKIIEERKEKQVEIKKEFNFSSEEPDGLSTIKNILTNYEDVSYIAAGRYLIKIKAEDYKKANQKMDKILKEIEEKAEKQKAKFEIKEKKK